MNVAELAQEIFQTREALARHECRAQSTAANYPYFPNCQDCRKCAPDAPAPTPASWTVSLDRYRSTWNYFTTNPSGGGFGSNYCGPKRIAQDKALSNIPAGDQVTIITRHYGEEISRETVTRPTSTRLETILQQPARSARP